MTRTENERDQLVLNLKQESGTVAVVKEKLVTLEKLASEKSNEYENQLKVARTGLESKQNEISARQVEIEKLKSELENRRGTIEKLESELEVRKRTIEALESSKQQQNNQLQSAMQQLKDKVIDLSFFLL